MAHTFRVFISSTFADLKAERDALQSRVWPKVAELCENEGFRFQAIDLRWGVSEEAGLDQQTPRMCLRELKRCQDTSPRPNFVVLLGNRYGWRPLPDVIEATEFESLERRAAQTLEAEPLLLREWYLPDHNSVARVDPDAASFYYYLRARNRDTVEADHAWWRTEVELPLSILLRTCARDLWPDDDERRIKYERSITEQEILAGALHPDIADADQHVFAYLRELQEAPELTPSAIVEPKLRRFVDVDAHNHLDEDAHSLQQGLKKRLHARLGDDHVRRYSATVPAESVSTDHIAQLSHDVLDDLTSVIQAEIDRFTAAPANEMEVSAHIQFGIERGSDAYFRGRTALRTQVGDYLANTEHNRPLVIHGRSGTGKSAAMARTALDASEQQPHAVVLQRFVGATPASADGRSLLYSLCEQLGHVYDRSDELPTEYRDLVGEFRDRLAWASPNKPVLVFLDALDHLSDADNARSLAWLPRQLPENVRIVVSTLDDPIQDEREDDSEARRRMDPLATLRRRSRAEDLILVDDYPRDDAEALLTHWLLGDNRTLTPGQRDLVLAAFARCPRPLFLKLAAEEAKLWRSDSTDMRMPKDDSPEQMLTAIITQMFDRLSQPSSHGPRLVDRALGYLVAAKNGLTESELLGLLSSDPEFFEPFKERAESVNQPLPSGIEALPVAVWVRLYSDLQPYLTSRHADGTTLLTFYHRSLERAARHRALATEEVAAERHQHIAAYFSPDEPHGFFRLTLDEQREWAMKLPPEPRPVHMRMVVELPHQLLEVAKLLGRDDAKSPHWDAVADLLLDIHFLEAKAEAGG